MWDRLTKVFGYVAEGTLERARQEHAPVNALYRRLDGVWVLFDELSEEAQRCVEVYAMTFKTLTPAEEEEYRQYAREHDPEDLARWEIYHPICRDEWEKRGIHP